MNDVFLIGGKSVKLKEDVTLEEEDRINELLKKAGAEGNTVSVNLTNKELIDLLPLICESKDGSDIAWGKCTRKTAAQIIASFFLSVISSSQDIAKIFADSMKNMKEHMTDTGG
jgi:hypothetical protein